LALSVALGTGFLRRTALAQCGYHRCSPALGKGLVVAFSPLASDLQGVLDCRLIERPLRTKDLAEEVQRYKLRLPIVRDR
jgi:hypothetical protein